MTKRYNLVLASVLFVTFANADDTIRMIAHRGGVVSDATIENNLSAIEAAVRRGYWMVEVDIRQSADNVPVVHHDADFRRYYGDSRKVSELTWDQISKLRASPGNERPLSFDEYLQAVDGRLRIMLDVKGTDLPAEFVDQIESSLRERDQLKTAYVIGAEQVKQQFTGKAVIGRNYDQIVAAKEIGENVSSRYFFFPRGSKFMEPEIERAMKLGVPVVPSVNVFHYSGINHLERAKRDIDRMRIGGVTQFQIDSVYDQFFADSH